MDAPVTPTVRISLPSKGRLAEESLEFLESCGFSVYKPNPRQYQATIKGLPEVVVLFQRPGDIVTSVRDGSVDFGISGLDVIAERQGDNGDVLILHDALGFGGCSLALAVPDGVPQIPRSARLVAGSDHRSDCIPPGPAGQPPGAPSMFLGF